MINVYIVYVSDDRVFVTTKEDEDEMIKSMKKCGYDLESDDDFERKVVRDSSVMVEISINAKVL